MLFALAFFVTVGSKGIQNWMPLAAGLADTDWLGNEQRTALFRERDEGNEKVAHFSSRKLRLAFCVVVSGMFCR
jgi:hypothetical protein